MASDDGIPKIYTYSPKDVEFTFDGINLASGIDPDSSVTVKRSAKKYSYVPDISGLGGARLLTSNNSAIIEVNLWQNSTVNELLFEQYKLDDGQNTNSIASFTFKGKAVGGMSYQKATHVWISASPDTIYQDSLTSLKWEFTASDLTTI